MTTDNTRTGQTSSSSYYYYYYCRPLKKDSGKIEGFVGRPETHTQTVEVRTRQTKFIFFISLYLRLSKIIYKTTNLVAHLYANAK